MPSFSTTLIKLNSNAVIPVVGSYMNQIPVFLLSALNSTLGNILEATVILFYFF